MVHSATQKYTTQEYTKNSTNSINQGQGVHKVNYAKVGEVFLLGLQPGCLILIPEGHQVWTLLESFTEK